MNNIVKLLATHDPGCGASYLYLSDEEADDGSCVRQIEVEELGLIIDLDKHGKIVGFEFLNSHRLPAQFNRRANGDGWCPYHDRPIVNGKCAHSIAARSVVVGTEYKITSIERISAKPQKPNDWAMWE